MEYKDQLKTLQTGGWMCDILAFKPGALEGFLCSSTPPKMISCLLFFLSPPLKQRVPSSRPLTSWVRLICPNPITPQPSVRTWLISGELLLCFSVPIPNSHLSTVHDCNLYTCKHSIVYSFGSTSTILSPGLMSAVSAAEPGSTRRTYCPRFVLSLCRLKP